MAAASFAFQDTLARETGWICQAAASNILLVTTKLTTREIKQALKIGKGSPLLLALAVTSFHMRKLHKDLPKTFRYRSHEEFFIKHGKLYHPRKFPKRCQLWRGKPKECLYNALLFAVMYPELDYVEGYALHADTRIDHPVEHAWCVDAKGNVIDPTWHEKVGREYFGVAMDKWLLAEQHQNKLPFGLMFNWKLLEDVMCGKAKGWKKMLAKRPDAKPNGKLPS